jgi:hypothetical protein
MFYDILSVSRLKCMINSKFEMMVSFVVKKYPSASGDCMLSLQETEAGLLVHPSQYSRYTILFI